ncbi:hypothetical protein [Kitasatospora sp. NPDC088134]|uniref:hypothetical protein n=1 Tax=Kitasatospora sp. NPDC088134 TaxID=3364071 RepID=UPI00382DDA65
MKPGIIRTATRVLRRRPGLLCFPLLGLSIVRGVLHRLGIADTDLTTELYTDAVTAARSRPDS